MTSRGDTPASCARFRAVGANFAVSWLPLSEGADVAETGVFGAAGADSGWLVAPVQAARHNPGTAAASHLRQFRIVSAFPPPRCFHLGRSRRSAAKFAKRPARPTLMSP
ncbi:hypothetical protein GCM10009565_32850 [Amycolatopsis albidoflavus]